MVRQFLLIAGLAAGLCASAQVARQTIKPGQNVPETSKITMQRSDIAVAKTQLNDGSNHRGVQKAANTSVSWRRPAGQFWGTGNSPESPNSYYQYTPLVLRPWVNYTFVNQSTATKGTPSWNVQYFDFTQTADGYVGYVETTEKEEDLTWSWQQYEQGHVPVLTVGKGSIPYPSQYNKESKTSAEYQFLCINKNIESNWSNGMEPVSSHYWSLYTRNSSDRQGLISYYGAKGYDDGVVGDDGETEGWWFGTNAMGYNAMATRFEKPEQPYLLNAVYWYYAFEGSIDKEIPVKAYVFKTLDPAKEYTGTSATTGNEFTIETCELGDLIAEAEAVIPMATATDDYWSDMLTFEFKKKNPVTGAETAYSLEIEDDITVVVVGYNVNPGPETSLRTSMSNDEYDEGYGNLGFLGWYDVAEDGSVDYRLTALKDFFASPLPNTTLGVLADVTYPWLQDYYVDQARDIQLPNDGETTEEVQGLQYVVPLLSTSETTEFDVTFDGEDECDWLAITDVYDEMDENDEGEEEFTGTCALEFTAAANPDDVKRTCHVKISIPAASYELIFRQGTGNIPEAVEVVAVEGAEQYYDLAGRRVMNPEKGLY
ncbi:MAG: hypothetical protein K2K93_11280, partial [Muribaculaceae bacterium]|nr:hypothetical protein [Muribaculaceae bacterium]